MNKPHTMDWAEIEGAENWGPLEKVRYVLETERDIVDAEINDGAYNEIDEARAVAGFEALQWALDILNHEFAEKAGKVG